MHVDEVQFSFDVADNARHRQSRQSLLRYRKGQIERRKADRNDDQNEVEVASRGIEAAQDIPQQTGGVAIVSRPYQRTPRIYEQRRLGRERLVGRLPSPGSGQCRG